MSQQIVIQKLVDEVLHGSGCTTTPEPEELKGLKETHPQIQPSTTNLKCIKPVRRKTPNKSFHRFSPELWSIIATRLSVCPICGDAIRPRDEITLFQNKPTWCHFKHIVDEATPEKNFHYELVY